MSDDLDFDFHETISSSSNPFMRRRKGTALGKVFHVVISVILIAVATYVALSLMNGEPVQLARLLQ
ncbi:MAG: hypothetical protein KTR19_12980 [Hyphomicrobiales bacterium]|nr:hypothetical protein [Hyphomicrobiales bacterium]